MLPTCQRYGMGVIPWSPLARRLAVRAAGARARTPPRAAARRALPDRYDLSKPENQRKLDAVEELALLAEESGHTLIELAIAFVIRHPAVTAAIIGPRTMEQLESQLPAADVELPDDVLDRIDAIVPPGTNVNPVDAGWQNPALKPEARRR